MRISAIWLNRSMNSRMTIAAVAILFALGPIIVNQAFAYGGNVGDGSYGGYVGYHHQQLENWKLVHTSMTEEKN